MRRKKFAKNQEWRFNCWKQKIQKIQIRNYWSEDLLKKYTNIKNIF